MKNLSTTEEETRCTTEGRCGAVLQQGRSRPMRARGWQRGCHPLPSAGLDRAQVEEEGQVGTLPAHRGSDVDAALQQGTDTGSVADSARKQEIMGGALAVKRRRRGKTALRLCFAGKQGHAAGLAGCCVAGLLEGSRLCLDQQGRSGGVAVLVEGQGDDGGRGQLIGRGAGALLSENMERGRLRYCWGFCALLLRS